MFFWIKRLVQNPRGIGSIAPSSPSLAKLMIKSLKPTDTVLELGPGTGVFTDKILSVLSSPNQLILIEQDSHMAAHCKQRFPSLTIKEQPAQNFLQINSQKFDAILSGIPFAALPRSKRQALFSEIAKHLKPDGTFIMFQYSVTTKKELKEFFPNVTTHFTLWNLPPAFVFVCKLK